MVLFLRISSSSPHMGFKRLDSNRDLGKEHVKEVYGGSPKRPYGILLLQTSASRVFIVGHRPPAGSAMDDYRSIILLEKYMRGVQLTIFKGTSMLENELAFSNLQTKVETVIIIAQKAMHEMDGELHAVEERLSGLEEALEGQMTRLRP